MEENMKDNIKMIENKDSVSLLSVMVESTKENGKMANNMEKVYSEKRILHVKEFGKMVREYVGLIKQNKMKLLEEIRNLRKEKKKVPTNND